MKLQIAGLTEKLSEQGYYHGLIPREDASHLLQENGDFILRITEPQKGLPQSIVLSVMWDKAQSKAAGIKHYVIIMQNGQLSLNSPHPFTSLNELIEYHMHHKISIDANMIVLIKRGVNRCSWEIKHSQVQVLDKLGEGAYGEVCRGTYNGKPAAIKQNHMQNLSKEQIKEVMSEARTMRQVSHRNIVRLFGIAALDEPLLIVMELASSGSLDSYIKKNGGNVDEIRKSRMCYELSLALVCLKDNQILHRDIAARNCLLDHGVVKLSDFGKSQPGPTFTMEATERLPIRWLSPETMRNRTFNYASEVWSFGAVCYEIFTNGNEPYPGFMVREVNEMVVNGKLLLKMPLSTHPIVRKIVDNNILVLEPNRYTIEQVAIDFWKFIGLKLPSESVVDLLKTKAPKISKSAKKDKGSKTKKKYSTGKSKSAKKDKKKKSQAGI